MRALAVAAVALSSSVAVAQPAPLTAQQVVNDVQKTYASAKGSISIGFKQDVIPAIGKQAPTKPGNLYLGKPDRFRFDYLDATTAAHRKSIIFDGTDLWVIEPDKLQVLQQTVTPGTLPTAITFWNGASLAADYHLSFATKSSPGAPTGGLVVELTPKKPSAAVQHGYLVVDKATMTVSQLKIIGSSGDENIFAFGKVNLAATIPATTFQFSKTGVPSTWKIVTNPGAAPPAKATPPTPPPKAATPPPATKP